MRCRSCQAELPSGVDRCPECGAPIAASSVLSMHVGGEERETEAPLRPAETPSSSASRPASAFSSRFPPGAVVDGRYRVVGALGAGGMGEVYRAEDERLGTLVALKFLPDTVSQDVAQRERLIEEVRTARVVTHPNVCRVHDVGEADGQLYLSMELVDGEDLGALLKRIGRPPTDKALELARQLCAGLAAAHARGILHRDLKPGNVMIDAEGRARITDFGLAIAGEASGAEALAGTPLYMAPEQLEGREATIKSDLYALGLLLYELFTGRRPHEGARPDDLLAARRRGDTARVSAVVPEVDVAVEDVIDRLLDPDPRMRPSSALAVAAALPGSDSLEARLAAGETPSPELIAAAGGVGGVAHRTAVLLAASVVLLGLASLWMNGRTSLVAFEELPLAPEVLRHQARELLARVGHDPDPRDWAHGVGRNGMALRYLAGRSDAADRWEALRELDVPSSIVYWYRQHSDWLDPEADNGMVTWEDPARVAAGMSTVILSPGGSLLHLEAVAPTAFDPERAGSRVDWSTLFEAAGLPPPRPDQAVEPKTVPPTAYDELHVWEASHPEAPDLPLLVHAAGFEGRPVRFVLEWDPDPVTGSASGSQSLADMIRELVGLVVFLGAVILAWRAWGAGRADRRGAMRLASVMFVTSVSAWVARVHVVPSSPQMFQSFFANAAGSAYVALIAWAIYLALEGFVRRVWPRCLVAWTRLLSGGWRDPMVGHEVLVGVAVGSFVTLMRSGARALVPALGNPPLEPQAVRWETMLSTRYVIGELFISVPQGLMMGFGLVLFFVILRGLLRVRWLALATLSVILFATAPVLVTSIAWLDFAQSLLLTAAFVLLVQRYGVLAIAVGATWAGVSGRLPATFEFGAWYGHVGLCVLVVLAVVATYGYRVAAPSWARRP